MLEFPTLIFQVMARLLRDSDIDCKDSNGVTLIDSAIFDTFCILCVDRVASSYTICENKSINI